MNNIEGIKNNINSSWINFEAGALSKSIDTSKVCPFLFDLQASVLTGTPLTQFQLTTNSKNDILSMFKSLNNSLNDKCLDENTLEKISETFWTSIEENCQKY